jgi:glucose/arabinose dehydrogenase/mono/diheme cytochrome c family protein
MNRIIIAMALPCLLLALVGCKNGTSNDANIATDSATIARGQAVFSQQCSACHTFLQEGIGPALGGITTLAEPQWILSFVKNPKGVIDSGDERARKLFEKYHTVMPSFAHVAEADLQALLAYLHTQKTTAVAKDTGSWLANPIPQAIPLSELVVELTEVAQFQPSAEQMPRTRITRLDHQPGSGDLFVLDLRGKLYKLAGGKPVVYMDMALARPKFINSPGLATGFGSFAFHPDFQRNGLLYTTHTELPASGKPTFPYADSVPAVVQWVITEWKTKMPAATPFAGEGRELFRINMVSGIHGVQEVIFNPLARPGSEDFGLLYIGVGDGGCVEHGHGYLAHNPQKPWGTVLRIDPAGRNSANGQYGIPAGNPFAKDKQRLGEIYAYGFRNPHRITWSRAGQMLVSNIGQGNIESLNLIEPGHDYGWPVREGTFWLEPANSMVHVFALPANDDSLHFTYPVVQYDHDEGKAISGGFEYWGTALPALQGKFLFGDIPTGRLFYVNMADIHAGSQAPISAWRVSVKGQIKTLVELCGSDRVDVHFGRDAQGELYIMTKADGKLYKLTSATARSI